MQSRASVLIDCMPRTAFEFIADTDNDKKWRSYLTDSEGHAMAVGDWITQTYEYKGKSKTVEFEVSEYQPPETLVYVMHEPTKARFVFHCRAEGGSTRVSMSMSANLSGPAALFAGRAQSEADKLLRTDLQSLKTALESN